jgi:hypothetical protein
VTGDLPLAVYRPDAPGGEPTAFARRRRRAHQRHHLFIDPALFEVFGLPDRPDF